MEQYHRYYFWVTSDLGTHLLSTVSYSKYTAQNLIMEMEGCPAHAVEFSSKDNVNL